MAILDMDSIIIFFDGNFIRLRRGANTTKNQFNNFIDRSSVLGVTGYYADDFEDFRSLFPLACLGWNREIFDNLETREV